MTLKRKVDNAIRLIRQAERIAHDNGSALEVCYSGGKDSDVILHLARMSGVKFLPLYKNTTIDPPGTLKHCTDHGVEIVKPDKSFLQLIKEHGFPSRWRRFCCSHLKEYKIEDYAVLGIRRFESTARAKRYHEPEICRVFSKSEKCRQYYPILDFTQQDIAEFVEAEHIKCHPLYYDESGVFHPERRLGCMCCPLQSKKQRIEAFCKHPNMVKLYIRGGQQWLDTHPNVKSHEYYADAYEMFVGTIFFDTVAKFQFSKNGLFGKLDCKELLEHRFGITFVERGKQTND